jgi:hypothetical protein
MHESWYGGSRSQLNLGRSRCTVNIDFWYITFGFWQKTQNKNIPIPVA